MTQQLGLSRSTLLSLITICTVLVLFATGATFAAWTNSNSASGTVTASAVTIDVIGSPGPGLSFTTGGGCTGPTMSQGETCTETVKVTNLSTTTSVTLAPPVAVVSSITSDFDPVGCANVASNWLVVADSPGSLGLSPLAFTTFDVTVTLGGSAEDGCQGETATITVTVSATEA